VAVLTAAAFERGRRSLCSLFGFLLVQTLQPTVGVSLAFAKYNDLSDQF
jgi:hypothetical protein